MAVFLRHGPNLQKPGNFSLLLGKKNIFVFLDDSDDFKKRKKKLKKNQLNFVRRRAATFRSSAECDLHSRASL